MDQTLLLQNIKNKIDNLTAEMDYLKYKFSTSKMNNYESKLQNDEDIHAVEAQVLELVEEEPEILQLTRILLKFFLLAFFDLVIMVLLFRAIQC
ncbi:unnamed protein product [Caenorhabditis angaria]|uniref:Uncharacterized protein n=1 Tax=Caenorhabditis angaria TaxID=860376 RepID=A0A9P1NA17_9PELO|nr:unnamed protein product [Caenorhabditis angaria]